MTEYVVSLGELNVIANSKEEAEEKVMQMIKDGWVTIDTIEEIND